MSDDEWERWREEAVRDFVRILDAARAEKSWGRFGVVVSMQAGEPGYRVVTAEESRK